MKQHRLTIFKKNA